ncbi:MAG: tyrosine-type recombinase/integrase [Actinomycetes bacterium]
MSGESAALAGWEEIEVAAPVLAATMRRYLVQLDCVLRPGSVRNTDGALRAFATFLIDTAPEVATVAAVTRRHIEDYKPWLAARPGKRVPRVTTNTIAHRLGTLRMFFVRIDEWGWDDAPPRVPIVPGDLPRQQHPLPKALDDAAAAKFLRAAEAQPRLLVRVVCEVLLRTGLRVGEFTGLRADAVVLIGAGHWLHVPVGKLRDDRYLPLHPHLVELIDSYRAAHVPTSHPLLIPRENGRPLSRHNVTAYLNKAAEAAGIGHVHPHQMRHTLATQAINRGMSLEAIAALLGHHSLDMTLRYAKIANRTVADEYFAVTERSRPSTANRPSCPPTRSDPPWPSSAETTSGCSATDTAPGHPSWTARSSRSARPAPTSRPASSSAPPSNTNTTTRSRRTRPVANSSSPSSSTGSTTRHREHPNRGRHRGSGSPSSIRAERCRRDGGVNVEHAQRSEHERR